jgi:hypothetical protein
MKKLFWSCIELLGVSPLSYYQDLKFLGFLSVGFFFCSCCVLFVVTPDLRFLACVFQLQASSTTVVDLFLVKFVTFVLVSVSCTVAGNISSSCRLVAWICFVDLGFRSMS